MTISIALRRPWLPRNSMSGDTAHGGPEATGRDADMVLNLAVITVECWRSDAHTSFSKRRTRTDRAVASRTELNYEESPI
jgi:hypothetical protein